ncbi:sigma factor-like helix-turn-helix DNA-binding protein [Serratia fonticola]|uniref:sigma factor-like helix-turn-helix DNA-binding protein n=1 Tax=Serratia fonticola TaxID=47917 RepID=UPI0013774A6C|nr:sigma factor-like helix-turn-helix DNA-binding protein [Serratia fonticola]NCG53641.1 hypothetical protein [Serratia fonticola]
MCIDDPNGLASDSQCGLVNKVIDSISLLNISAYPAFLTDMQGAFIYTNPAFHQFLILKDFSGGVINFNDIENISLNTKLLLNHIELYCNGDSEFTTMIQDIWMLNELWSLRVEKIKTAPLSFFNLWQLSPYFNPISFSKNIPQLNTELPKRNSIIDLSAKLTAREEAVFSMRFMGYSYDYISSKMLISPETVKKHWKSARKKHELIFYNDDELLDAIILSHRYASIQRNVIGIIYNEC